MLSRDSRVPRLALAGPKWCKARKIPSHPGCSQAKAVCREVEENRSEIKAIREARVDGPKASEKRPWPSLLAKARAARRKRRRPAKWLFTFGDGKAEGRADSRDLLGGKGANLAEMANLGLPVPPGFTIPTSVCNYFIGGGMDKTCSWKES